MEASDYDYYITGNDYKNPSNAKRSMETNKTAKITRTTFVSEWKSPQGTQVYYHTIELDNGDSGQIGSKEKMPAKLNPGSELTYTIESTSRGNKIKAVVPAGNQFQGKGRPQVDHKQQVATFAMSYTKDLIVASQVKLADMEVVFDRMYKAIMSKVI
jgi:hypothetical protein